jgi:hypothetical protein
MTFRTEPLSIYLPNISQIWFISPVASVKNLNLKMTDVEYSVDYEPTYASISKFSSIHGIIFFLNTKNKLRTTNLCQRGKTWNVIAYHYAPPGPITSEVLNIMGIL